MSAKMTDEEMRIRDDPVESSEEESQSEVDRATFLSKWESGTGTMNDQDQASCGCCLSYLRQIKHRLPYPVFVALYIFFLAAVIADFFIDIFMPVTPVTKWPQITSQLWLTALLVGVVVSWPLLYLYPMLMRYRRTFTDNKLDELFRHCFKFEALHGIYEGFIQTGLSLVVLSNGGSVEFWSILKIVLAVLFAFISIIGFLTDQRGNCAKKFDLLVCGFILFISYLLFIRAFSVVEAVPISERPKPKNLYQLFSDPILSDMYQGILGRYICIGLFIFNNTLIIIVITYVVTKFACLVLITLVFFSTFLYPGIQGLKCFHDVGTWEKIAGFSFYILFSSLCDIISIALVNEDKSEILICSLVACVSALLLIPIVTFSKRIKASFVLKALLVTTCSPLIVFGLLVLSIIIIVLFGLLFCLFALIVYMILLILYYCGLLTWKRVILIGGYSDFCVLVIFRLVELLFIVLFIVWVIVIILSLTSPVRSVLAFINKIGLALMPQKSSARIAYN